MRWYVPRRLGNQQEVIRRRAERRQQSRHCLNHLPLVAVTEHPLDGVLVAIATRCGEDFFRPPSLLISIVIEVGRLPEVLQLPHPTAAGNPGITDKAIAAVQITSEHPERHRVSPRKCVEERLLLDGIALQGPDVAARHHQRATLVVADLADAPQTLLDE